MVTLLSPGIQFDLYMFPYVSFTARSHYGQVVCGEDGTTPGLGVEDAVTQSLLIGAASSEQFHHLSAALLAHVWQDSSWPTFRVYYRANGSQHASWK